MMRISTLTGLPPPTRSISRSWTRAQQFRLKAKIHLADFVEQQRAAVGLLEFADAAGDSAGEGAFFVAEEFGFQEISGIAAQLTEINGLLARATFAVDIACHHFLAGADSPVIRTLASLPGDLVGDLSPACHGRP